MTLTIEQRIYLFKLNKLTRNNISRAMKMFEQEFHEKISRTAVSNYWGGAGFPRNPRGGNHHGFTEDAFRVLHRRTKGNLDDMMERTGYTESGLRQLCYRYDLTYSRTPKTRQNRNQYTILENFVGDGVSRTSKARGR